MPRSHWLHHQQTAWRLSYGNSHLQGARPFGSQAHSELVTIRWCGVSNVCVIGHRFGMFTDGRGLFNKSTSDLVFTMYLHCNCILFRSQMYCICIVPVVPLSCACIVHECTRHTHTRIRITETFCVDGMQSKLRMRVATLFQRLPIPLEFEWCPNNAMWPHCLHHQKPTCHPSRSTSQLQRARPCVPHAHSELEATH